MLRSVLMHLMSHVVRSPLALRVQQRQTATLGPDTRSRVRVYALCFVPASTVFTCVCLYCTCLYCLSVSCGSLILYITTGSCVSIKQSLCFCRSRKPLV